MLKLLYQRLEGVLEIKKFDTTIIGAGPIGLFCASFAHLHGLKTVTFEALKEIGGQPKLLYPFKEIFDIPVFGKISGQELTDHLIDSAKDKTTFQLNHRVTSIEKNDQGFIIDNDFQVKSIIIATGTGSFSPKKFPLKMDETIEKRVHYFVKDPSHFAGKSIGVFGGGDSALDWALELAKQPGTKINLIHRRADFRGLESTLQELKSLKNVQVLTPYLPKTIAIRNNQLDIGLKQVGQTELLQKQFDQIVVAYGFRANNSIVRKWGVDLEDGHIKVSREMEANIPGIYAIGDVAAYPGKVPVIGLGFGEAQIAVTAIMRALFPEKTLTIHSTSI